MSQATFNHFQAVTARSRFPCRVVIALQLDTEAQSIVRHVIFSSVDSQSRPIRAEGIEVRWLAEAMCMHRLPSQVLCR
jgi:hypothetical protein